MGRDSVARPSRTNLSLALEFLHFVQLGWAKWRTARLQWIAAPWKVFHLEQYSSVQSREPKCVGAGGQRGRSSQMAKRDIASLDDADALKNSGRLHRESNSPFSA